MNPSISVIIPTYNRAESLKETLQALQKQTLNNDDFEVHVQVDGSTDSTVEMLQSMQTEMPNLQFKIQDNQGASAARNASLENCQAPVIVFIGDDIVVEPNFLEAHKEFHAKHSKDNEGALGFTYPDLERSKDPEFVRWIHESGVQFGYAGLQEEQELDYRYFYTSNISLKKEMLKEERFDESFSGWGFEDSELGLRLSQKKDFELRYWPKARACHTESFDEEKVGNRLRKSARNLKKFQSMHPETAIWPTRTQRTIEWIVTARPIQVLAGLFSRKWAWKLKMKRCFLEGLNLID